ncbi:DUF1043 family protein [Candidatus Accumulibacter sp. ACC007]|uniref:YhcB family protein n=1 Tax=Candidatus Accumulibacter sp. ACC007 TaxID=2823333 RepID=UPI0025BD90BD|nr:DUF1043 family protein [Candidatus Accumulibacter sp. ACC007]
MTEQTMWLIGGAAVIVAALIGYFVGRSPLGGKTKRVAALEAEVSRQQDEIAGYKRDVESHFDKTATLVASMAGSYKDLFEHLSSGYEQLSSGSARQLFRDRVVGLLVGSAGGATVAEATSSDKVSAALIAAGAQPRELSTTGQGSEAERSAAAGAEAAADAKDVAAPADAEAAMGTAAEGEPAQQAEKSSSEGSRTPAGAESKPAGDVKAASEGQAKPGEKAGAAAGAKDEGGEDGTGKGAGKDTGASKS